MTLDIKTIESNIRIRDIKLLFSHTVLRLRFLIALRLFRKLDFRLSHLLCLFKKGDYFYRQQIPERFPLSDFHLKNH